MPLLGLHFLSFSGGRINRSPMSRLHALQQILEARVGTQVIEARIDTHVRQRGRSFLEGYIKPAKRLVPFSQARMDEGYRVRHYVFVPAELIEVTEDAKRLASDARHGIGTAEFG